MPITIELAKATMVVVIVIEQPTPQATMVVSISAEQEQQQRRPGLRFARRNPSRQTGNRYPADKLLPFVLESHWAAGISP